MRESRVGTEQTISVQVLKCTCGDPGSHLNVPCPEGRLVDYGIVNYWHRNPVRRVIGQAIIKLRRQARGY